MQKFIDKFVLLGFCLLAMSFTEIGWESIIILFLALAVSSLCGYLENRFPVFLCIAYVVLCVFVSDFLIFLPLIVYDCVKPESGAGTEAGVRTEAGALFLRFYWVIVLPVSFITASLQPAIVITLSSGIAVLLQHRTSAQMSGRDKFFALMDSTKERAENLERRNRELLEKQDYEIRLATLAERNRIAREIHDNVGHMLTRSLLQVSALRVTHSDDEDLTGELNMIKSTLSDAMDSIRSSVHDLHDDSIDLKNRLEAMVAGFMFCPVKLRYDTGDLPASIKLCFAAIVRESLSNIAKHSNATEASITLMEHPSFYQLVISDNGAVHGRKGGGSSGEAGGDGSGGGTHSGVGGSGGIGLQNMSERVDALNGVFRIDQTKGFKIFISVPKK